MHTFNSLLVAVESK